MFGASRNGGAGPAAVARGGAGPASMAGGGGPASLQKPLAPPGPGMHKPLAPAGPGTVPRPGGPSWSFAGGRSGLTPVNRPAAAQSSEVERAGGLKVTEFVIHGGPYHTKPLQAAVNVAGGKEGASTYQWYKSVGDWWFVPIPGATGSEYQPTAEDLHCQIRVEYTPIAVDGTRHKSVITNVPPKFLTIDPAVSTTVERNIRDGTAIWEVTWQGDSRTIVANKEKIKIRKGNTTKEKESYNDDFKIVLSPTVPTTFTIFLSRVKKFEFSCDSTVTRDIIALTVNSFFTMAQNEKMSKGKVKKGVVIPSATTTSAEAARVSDLAVTGGPFHTSPLKVAPKAPFPEKTQIEVQWFRSPGENWYYTPIPGANQLIYQPSADDAQCKLRVELSVVSGGVVQRTSLVDVPPRFLVIDPAVASAVETNIKNSSAEFEVALAAKPKETITLSLDANSFQIIKGQKIIAKVRHSRVRTLLPTEQPTLLIVSLGGRTAYQFLCATHIMRDVIVFTVQTFASLGAITRRHMAISRKQGDKKHKAVQEMFQKKEEDFVFTEKPNGEAGGGGWGGWGNWGDFNDDPRRRRRRQQAQARRAAGRVGGAGAAAGGGGANGQDPIRGSTASAKDELAALGRSARPQRPIDPSTRTVVALKDLPQNPMFAPRTGGKKGDKAKWAAHANVQAVPAEVPIVAWNGDGPPPPPPPPPMPGGPPPPPPPPGMGPTVAEREQKTKQLHWEKVSRAAIDQSVWAKTSDLRVDIDDDLMAEMFKFEDARALGANKVISDGDVVKLSKSHQINIVVEGTKMTPDEIFEAVLSADSDLLDAAAWVQLLTFVPTDEEAKKLSSFSGDVGKLGRPEQLFFQLLKIPRLKQRLESIVFKLNLVTAVPDLQEKILAINNGCKQLMTSQKFVKILEIILGLGNFLNFGTRRGFAVGFKLNALKNLENTKAIDRKTTLLHYLANYVSERQPEIMEFVNELREVEKASKVSFQTLNQDLEQLVAGLNAIETEIQKSTAEPSGLQGDFFLKEMTEWIDFATDTVGVLVDNAKIMRSNTEKLAVFFAEEVQGVFNPEEMFLTLQTFISAFERSHRENVAARERLVKAQERQDALANAGFKASVSADPKPMNALDLLMSVRTKFQADEAPEGAQAADGDFQEEEDGEDGDYYEDDFEEYEEDL